VARFITGEVVVLPFPFSDLSSAKKRPALVIAVMEGDDVIVCQITSQAKKDRYAIPLDSRDFETGGLKLPSHVRPNRIFTADSSLVLYRAGVIRTTKLNDVIAEVVKIIRP
jgi:mRNA interferase MazF